MKLLVFAHTPPPHHGQSYIVQLLLERLPLSRRIECFHVNSRFSENIADIGRPRLGKAWRVFRYCVQAIRMRFRHSVRHLYYIPASPHRAAMYRDWMIMALCRPFFSHLIYHWEAAGLGDWIQTKSHWWERLVSHWLLGRPDLSIVLTDHNRRDGEQLRSKRIAVVANGIPDPCPGRDRQITHGNVFSALFIGACTRGKGLFDAVEAIALANKQATDQRFRLLVAGSFWRDEERRAFDQRSAELRFPDGSPQVEYLGFISGEQKGRLFRECNCLCFPTYYEAESCPIVLLEAMAYGLPIITTRWRMIPDLLPKDYPYVVNPQVFAEVTEALLRVSQDGLQIDLREHFLRNFTAEQFIEKIEAALVQSSPT